MRSPHSETGGLATLPPRAVDGTREGSPRSYVRSPIARRPVLPSSQTGAESPENASRELTQAPRLTGRDAAVVPTRAVGSRDRLKIREQWEGEVIRMKRDTFVARLADLRDGQPDEKAEFLLSEVPAPDRKLVRQGAIFYWTIGLLVPPDSIQSMVSKIRFRRLLPPSTREFEAARAWARETIDLIGPAEGD